MVRLCTSSDASALAQHLTTWANQVGTTVRIDLNKIKAGLADPNHLAIIDTATNTFLLLNVDRTSHEVQVESIFTDNATPLKIKSLLKDICQRVLIKFPNSSGWHIWAEFLWGRDAQGNPDGGKSACLKFQQLFPYATVKQVSPENPKGQWIIEYTVGGIVA